MQKSLHKCLDESLASMAICYSLHPEANAHEQFPPETRVLTLYLLWPHSKVTHAYQIRSFHVYVLDTKVKDMHSTELELGARWAIRFCQSPLHKQNGRQISLDSRGTLVGMQPDFYQVPCRWHCAAGLRSERCWDTCDIDSPHSIHLQRNIRSSYRKIHHSTKQNDLASWIESKSQKLSNLC